MARRGFGGMTALRAALGAAVGVGEGLQQREILAAQREKERLATERQRRLDEAALRAEERQAVDAGMISASRIPTLTMPGATPLPDMEPTLRQNIGGKEYVYIPRVAQAERHRADVMRRSLDRAEKKPEKRIVNGQIVDMETEEARPIKGYKAPVRRAAGGGLSATQQAKIEQERKTAEAIFNTPMLPSSPLRQALGNAFNALRENDPEADPLDLMRSAVAATRAMGVKVDMPKPAGAKGGRAGGRVPSAPPPGVGAAQTPTAATADSSYSDLRSAFNRGR